MIEGQLEDVSALQAIQYVRAGKASGILVLKHVDQKEAKIIFRDGRLVNACSTFGGRLGDIVIAKGLLTADNLRKAAQVQKSNADASYFGEVLQEQYGLEKGQLKSLVLTQLEIVLAEVLGWNKGSFNFQKKSADEPAEFSFDLGELVLPEELDTELILSESVKKIQNTKETPRVIAGSEEKPTLSKSDVEILREMLFHSKSLEQSQLVSLTFLKILSKQCQRAVLFFHAHDELRGIGGFGMTVDKLPVNEEIRNFTLTLEKDELPSLCMSRTMRFHGTPPAEKWLKFIFEKIGPPRHPEIILLPMMGVERGICLVYGDNGDLDVQIKSVDLMELAAGQAGIIMENVYLRKQLQMKTSKDM